MKKRILKIFALVFACILMIFTFGGASAEVKFNYGFKSKVKVTLENSLTETEFKNQCQKFVDGYNIVSGDNDIVQIQSIRSIDGGYELCLKLRRIDKVKGMGDFDYAEFAKFAEEESERRTLIERWANGSWRYSVSVSINGERGSVEIDRNHKGKNPVLPKTLNGETLTIEDFFDKGKTAKDNEKLVLFRLINTQEIMGEIKSIEVTFDGKIKYYAGNGIEIKDEKTVVLTSTVLQGNIFAKDENGEVQSCFNQDLNVIYGYVVLKQGLSPLAVTAIIALSIGFIGLIVAICVAFTRMGKKYREEMEKTEKNKGEQTCRS